MTIGEYVATVGRHDRAVVLRTAVAVGVLLLSMLVAVFVRSVDPYLGDVIGIPLICLIAHH